MSPWNHEVTNMKFKLKSLHRNGTVLAPEELADAPCHVGNLIIEDCPQEGVFRRPIRHARLLDMNILQAPRDVTPPLFDPQLVRMLDNQMVLHGYQIHVDMETEVINHYVQVWVLRPVTDE